MVTKNLHFVSFRDLPIVYGRVPKVANSSIKAALSKLLKEKPGEGGRFQSDGYWHRLTKGETEMVSPKVAWKLRKEKYVFAFVRNPLDRVVSCYHNKILNLDAFTPQMKATGYKPQMSFPDFVQKTSEIPDTDLDVHIMPQTEMLMNNGLLVPQFIGHFEQMEDEWARLRRRLARRCDVTVQKLPRKNVRREDHDDVARYFNSDKLVELAMTKFAKDVEIFYPGVTADQLVSGNFEIPTIQRPVKQAADRQHGKGETAETSVAQASGD